MFIYTPLAFFSAVSTRRKRKSSTEDGMEDKSKSFGRRTQIFCLYVLYYSAINFSLEINTNVAVPSLRKSSILVASEKDFSVSENKSRGLKTRGGTSYRGRGSGNRGTPF